MPDGVGVGAVVAVLLVVVGGALLGLLLTLRRRDKLRYEPLGAPPEPHTDPLIRTESRRRDSPGGTDLDVRGGREHDAP